MKEKLAKQQEADDPDTDRIEAEEADTKISEIRTSTLRAPASWVKGECSGNTEPVLCPKNNATMRTATVKRRLMFSAMSGG